MAITILTIIPSIYFGYTMVQQDRYNQKAEEFIKSEIATHPIPNVYLLDQEVDAANQKITLTYGGELIPKEEQEAMKQAFQFLNWKIQLLRSSKALPI